jgi:hypothetical protein
MVSYTSGTEFYTSFKVLLGDSAGGSTASSGVWTFYQGGPSTNYVDNTDVSNANVFTGLRFTYGASGALTLTFNNAGTYNSTGLTTSSFSQGTVYTVEIVGNNKTSGTINYTYNGVAQTVAVQKFDLYINGTRVGNDLSKGGLTAATAVDSVTFTGVSSVSNVANIFVDDVVVFNAVPATIGTSGATPPTLTAAPGATVDAPFNVTFTDDPTWRAAITSIKVAGTTLTAGSSVTAGQIAFTPSASSPAALLQSSGTKTITVQATGYSDASVSQTIGPGTATQLGMSVQPVGPATNGGALATQPVVLIRDQYANTANSTASVVAAVGSGTWTIGGTTSKNGVAGTTTFTDLTATSAAAVTGATISFTSTGLTGVTSNTFNIPAPPPANDNPAGAITLTVNATATSGTLTSATPMTGATKNDVFYKFVATSPTATVTINNFGVASDKDLYIYPSQPTTYTGSTGASAFGTTSNTTSEVVTSSAYTVGNTYWILVQDFGGGGGTFNISVTSPTITAAPSALSGFSTTSGIASSSQSFTASGINLSANITVTAPSSYEVSTDNTTFTPSVTLTQVSGTVATTTVYVRISAAAAAGSPSGNVTLSSTGAATQNVVVSGTVAAAATPPTLTPAGGATVDAPFNVTFSDDPTWRAAITGITVNGTPLTAGSAVSAGQITFTPSASSPAALLQTPGTKTIVVLATGYSSSSVSQPLAAGAANKLAMSVQPVGPTANGGALATQPVVLIQDQYANATASTATVVASVGAGSWTIGGTTSQPGVAGTATFTDLTAASAAAVPSATISFSSTGLSGVASSAFSIPAPPTTYYSQTSGDPTVLANWNTNRVGGGSSPANFSSGDTFVVQNSHTMTTGGAWTVSGTASRIEIESGGTLAANNLVVVPNFQVDNGGTYVHNAASGSSNGAATDVPGSTSRTFGASSNVEFQAWANGGTSPTSLPNVTWGNLKINIAALAGSINQNGVLSVAGNLTIAATGGPSREFRLSGNTSYTIAILGDLNISGGILNLTNGSNSGLTYTLNLGGSFNETGGSFIDGNTSSITSFNFSGGASSATFTQSAGTFTNTNVNFTVASAKTLGLSSSFPVPTSRSLTINGTLNCGAQIISGAGTFTLSPGSTLGIGSADGIVSSLADTTHGNIRTTTARNFDVAANYTYNGSAAQAAGSGLPATVNNLTISNTAAAVSLGSSETVNGVLTVNSSATLDFNSNTITTPNAPSFAGALTMEVTRTGTNTFTGSKLTRTGGTLTYGGTLTASVLSGTLAAGDSIPLFVSSGGFGGGFSSVTGPTTPGSLTRDVSQLTGGTGGNILFRGTPTLSISNSLVTYNGSQQSATVTASAPGTVSDVKYDGSSTAPTNAGTYAVTADFTPTDPSTYTSLNDASAGNFVINKANQVISGLAATDTKTYGDANYSLGATGGASGNAVTYVSSNTSVATISGNTVHIVAAGSTTITASQAGNSNYNPAPDATQALTVNQKAIHVTADSGQSKVKGTSDPTFTYTSDPLVGGDSFSGALSRNAGESAGSYSITQGSLTAGPNYSITFTGATFVISGPIADGDAATRPAGSSDIRIPLATLLAGDSRIASDGSSHTDNLTVTAVTAGVGNSVEIVGSNVFFEASTPSASAPLTFTYALHDSSSGADDTGTVTVTTVAATPFLLQIVQAGTPSYDLPNDQTTVSVDLQGVPNQNLTVQYSTDMMTWTTYVPNPVNTGATGSFNITIIVPGNQNSFFFQATRQ